MWWLLSGLGIAIWLGSGLWLCWIGWRLKIERDEPLWIQIAAE